MIIWALVSSKKARSCCGASAGAHHDEDGLYATLSDSWCHGLQHRVITKMDMEVGRCGKYQAIEEPRSHIGSK